MRTSRVYTDQPLSVGACVTLEEGPARHLAQVLRLKANASVVLFNGDGHDYQGIITTLQKRHVAVTLSSVGEAEPVPTLEIHLGLGISKSERMDFAIQKAVELGVSEITPLVTERCVVRISDQRMQKRLQHWRNIIISACEQSGRRRLPHLHETQPLKSWLDAHTHSSGFLLDHRSEQSFPDFAPPANATTLLVGPEGGLSEGERNRAKASGLQGARLGPHVLRTETAPLAAITALQTLWGDFR